MTPRAAPETLPILMVTGLAKEMRLAEGPGFVAIASGGSSQRLRANLDARANPGCRAVVSFGIAGGLDPALQPGDVVIASGVVANGKRRAAHAALADMLASSLADGTVRVHRGDIAGVDQPVLTQAAKAELRRESSALVVDMESHIAADFAARHGLHFAALRIVCDPASRSLPATVARAMKPDGGIDALAVIGDLIRNPAEIATLSRLAGEARKSFRALGRCRDLLGIGRGAPDLVELLGDVA